MKLTSKYLAAIFLCVIAASYFIYQKGCIYRQDSFESYPKLLMSLGDAEKIYGKAKTVAQADGAETLYLWPQYGFAVFTHPHYENQYKYIKRDNRKITSLLIPLSKDFEHPYANIAKLSEFDFVISKEMKNKILSDINKCKPISSSGDINVYSSSFIGLGGDRLYMYHSDEKPTFIEIKENRLFSWYD